jgi:hypothetical protein
MAPAPSMRINTRRPTQLPGRWPGGLRQRLADHRDVAGGGVRSRVARPQHHRQWPGALGPVVNKRPQRMKPETLLKGIGESRTAKPNGPRRRTAGLAMVFKLVEAANEHWRYVNGAHLVALVRAGAKFEKGALMERPDEARPRSPHDQSGHANP